MAQGLTHLFDLLRQLGEYSPLLSIESDTFLDIVHELMALVPRPPNTSVNAFLSQNLKEAYGSQLSTKKSFLSWLIVRCRLPVMVIPLLVVVTLLSSSEENRNASDKIPTMAPTATLQKQMSSICGTQLDSFLLQHLDETYNITTMDQNIRFIVDNRASASAGGGVCSTADEEPSLIGGKRIREPNATNTSKQTICTQWLKQSFLPDCRICWHSVLQ